MFTTVLSGFYDLKTVDNYSKNEFRPSNFFCYCDNVFHART